MERFLLLALVGVGLVACARAPSTPSPEKAVAARSMAYWGAMVDQQYTNAYELLFSGIPGAGWQGCIYAAVCWQDAMGRCRHPVGEV